MNIPIIIKQKIDTEILKEKVDESGAVLLRGFDIDTIEKFSDFSSSLGSNNIDMSCSAGPRVNMGYNVFTSNEAPPDKFIPPHHEMAQCKEYPSYVLFYCMIPAQEGGCTPIIQSSKVCKEFKSKFPDITKRIEKEGVRYLREFPNVTDVNSPLGKSWKDTFYVQTDKELEKVLDEQNILWKWLDNETIQTISEPVNIFKNFKNEETFFMAAETSLLNINYGPKKKLIFGNFDEFDEETINAFIYIGKFAYTESVRTPWEKYDVLVLNNNLVMHSRDPFVGERKILVSLVK
tara:strand:+ start:832 stop:1704 length:873 start_codon:yes stop_codon:yes gene_type:complete